MQLLLLVCNRLSKFLGNVSKIMLCYPFHFILPKKRFTIPEYSKAIIKGKNQTIPKHIWQTNYSNKVSLPIYLNYLFNRLLSLDYEHHYVSTEQRLAFVQAYANTDIIQTYQRLNDGAAQADLWRLLVLEYFGGVYIDIDAHLIFPLSKLIKKNAKELFIFRRKDNTYTNYFIAADKNHPVLTTAICIVKNNINSAKPVGVYSLTGPKPFDQAINKIKSNNNSKLYRYVCIQGNFTNEYFQYIDKPKSKWTHKKPDEILKKPPNDKKIIFLDRDGVINEEFGYLHKIEDFEFIDGVFDSCLHFQKLGFEIIIVTNQSGIGIGLYTQQDFAKLNAWVIDKFKQNGVKILAVFFCPHTAEDNCKCRKPKAGMFLQAQQKYAIDMQNSWMIGDKEADIQAANTANISNTILVRSGHKIDEKNSNAKFFLDSIKHAKTIIV